MDFFSLRSKFRRKSAFTPLVFVSQTPQKLPIVINPLVNVVHSNNCLWAGLVYNIGVINYFECASKFSLYIR